MKNQMKNFEQYFEAKNEKAISASDLISEFMPLLGEYFVGDFLFDGEAVTYVMLNGQRFIISATEIA